MKLLTFRVQNASGAAGGRRAGGLPAGLPAEPHGGDSGAGPRGQGTDRFKLSRKKSKLLLLFSERDIFFSNNDVAFESKTTSTIFRGEENGGVKSALRLM